MNSTLQVTRLPGSYLGRYLKVFLYREIRRRLYTGGETDMAWYFSTWAPKYEAKQVLVRGRRPRICLYVPREVSALKHVSAPVVVKKGDEISRPPFTYRSFLLLLIEYTFNPTPISASLPLTSPPSPASPVSLHLHFYIFRVCLNLTSILSRQSTTEARFTPYRYVLAFSF